MVGRRGRKVEIEVLQDRALINISPPPTGDQMLNIVNSIRTTLQMGDERVARWRSVSSDISRLSQLYPKVASGTKVDPRENDEVSRLLYSNASAIAELLNEELEGEGIEVGFNFTRPRGLWAANPWISLPVAKGGVLQDRFVGKHMYCSIYVNLLFGADMRALCLVIVPFSQAWMATFGVRWTEHFDALREEMRERLKSLEIERAGFQFDEAPLATKERSIGEQMRKGIVTYYCMDPGNVEAEDLRNKLVAVMRAYNSLLNGNAGGSFGYNEGRNP